MIVEFALTLSLALPEGPAPVVQAEFSPPIRQVVTYPPVGVVNRLTGLTLPEDTRQVFEGEFLDGNVFFGAFAVTKEFGYGYVTGVNSIEAARDIAMEECLKHGDTCLIYAEILPQGYVPLQPGQVGLSPEAAGYYTNPDPSWGSFRAMAVSEDGAYSLVWNYETQQLANEAALADCSQYVITDLPNLREMPCYLMPFK